MSEQDELLEKIRGVFQEHYKTDRKRAREAEREFRKKRNIQESRNHIAQEPQKVAIGYYRTMPGDDDAYRKIEMIKEKVEALGAHIDAMYADHEEAKDEYVEYPGLALLSEHLSKLKVDYVLLKNSDAFGYSQDKEKAADMIRKIEEIGAQVEFTGIDRSELAKLAPAIEASTGTSPL